MAILQRDSGASVAVGRSLSLDAFLALPEQQPGLELYEGMVTQKVAPQAQHVLLQQDFTQRVNAAARPGQVALAFSELRTTFAGVSRIPDVSVYRWHRLPRLDDGRVANRFEEPPDIAVEIVSPGQSVTELVSTCIWYVKNGVQIALIVDPDQEIVLRFRPDALPDVLRDADRIELEAVLPGFALTVSELFEALLLD